MAAGPTTRRSPTLPRSAPAAPTPSPARGAERVYVLPTQAGPRRIDRPPAGAIDAAIHALTLLVDARFAADLARYAHEVELIVLPAPNSRCVQPTDFEHASRLTAEALTACRDALAARPALDVAAEVEPATRPPPGAPRRAGWWIILHPARQVGEVAGAIGRCGGAVHGP